jgi:4-aminobutyrate aminotransferase-like enzyme
MARRNRSPRSSLAEIPEVREAAAALIAAVELASGEQELTADAYARSISDIERLRGRPLMFPMLGSGTGRGARVRLADGSEKLDFIGGIGVYAFGHADRDLLEHAVIAAATDTVFQGHLLPGPEYLRLSRLLVKHAGRRIRHAWLAMSGAMANENALKLIFQKHAPADRVVVFERAFHGRSAVMAELSDRPAFRDGQPLRGNVLHVPFFDRNDPESTAKSLAALDAHIRRHPGRIACMCFELVQGEGGFHTAPREFFTALMHRCKKAKLAVWVDEVQTFARTGELFAFRGLQLDEYVDVISVGKVLQGSATLFTHRYNPRPGLIAGTYAGATVGMAVGARIIERLESEGYLGEKGRVNVLARRIDARFASLNKRLPKTIGERSGIGAMQAFSVFDGSPEVARKVLEACFAEGLILLTAGSNPTKLRMLPPVNLTDEELEAAFAVLEKALRRVAEELDA